MRYRAYLIPVLACAAWAESPLDRLDLRHLEAVHAQRVEWMKQRMSRAPLGVFQDFRAIVPKHPGLDAATARSSEVRVVL
ncbi:MAG: hypothetical protein ABSB35_36905, partial [Bryobacteraceae bacterium]